MVPMPEEREHPRGAAFVLLDNESTATKWAVVRRAVYATDEQDRLAYPTDPQNSATRAATDVEVHRRCSGEEIDPLASLTGEIGKAGVPGPAGAPTSGRTAETNSRHIH
jgi:hypothetical protein